ncbi:hypothetical protein TNCV_4248041 [Trichonephila clavipes]|nr:hypothetical protein TNCV_4248041 [Trichonephila clavipes]
MEADNIDCALVQEPHSYRSTLPGYPSTYRLFYDPNSDIIKAAIIVRSRHLSTFIDYKNSDYNMVTLEVIAGSTAFTLFSYYFEPSKNIDSDLHKIIQVFSSKNLNRLVWSMDSNSKSELWFSPYSDARGNKLSEFISANNLFIINEDCGPTFRATQGTSYIDITVVGSELLEDNSSWCLSENESLSDHVMIEFEFCLSTVLRDTSSALFVIFNTKKANWCRFRKFCLSRMTHIFDTLNSCTNSSCLNTVIEELSFVIHQACLYSIPIKKTSKHNVPWWSIKIGCARKRLNASRRRFQRCKNPTVRELYKNSYLEYRKDYNQMLINAKSESRKKFLLTIDAQNVWKKVSFLGFGSLPRISWYLRRGDFLSSDQYGFTLHKSTEDALLRLNENVKRGKKKHLHSILISLDIKGAFDNAWWPCILNLLKKAEIPINIFSLVADFLNDRVAKMQLRLTSAIRFLERGCPQGSVSGPIFWNIIINDLLSKLNNLACCEIIAFADDIFSLFPSDKSTEDFPVICYTDGSKIDGRVGFAFVVFRSGVESENFQFRIRDECTVFVAELLCLNFAVKWITEQNSVISEYLICTDSLSSLDSLKCISSSNNIIVKIQKQLKSLRDKNISIDFAFVQVDTRAFLEMSEPIGLQKLQPSAKLTLTLIFLNRFTRRSRMKE